MAKEKFFHITVDGVVSKCKNRVECSITADKHSSNRKALFQKFSKSDASKIRENSPSYRVISNSEAVSLSEFIGSQDKSGKHISEETKEEALKRYDDRLYYNFEIEKIEVSEIIEGRMPLFTEERKVFYNDTVLFGRYETLSLEDLKNNKIKTEMASDLIQSIIQIHKEALHEINQGQDIVWQLMSELNVDFHSLIIEPYRDKFTEHSQGMVISLSEALLKVLETPIPKKASRVGFKIIFESILEKERAFWQEAFDFNENDFNSGALDSLDEYLEEYIPLY